MCSAWTFQVLVDHAIDVDNFLRSAVDMWQPTASLQKIYYMDLSFMSPTMSSTRLLDRSISEMIQDLAIVTTECE